MEYGPCHPVLYGFARRISKGVRRRQPGSQRRGGLRSERATVPSLLADTSIRENCEGTPRNNVTFNGLGYNHSDHNLQESFDHQFEGLRSLEGS